MTSTANRNWLRMTRRQVLQVGTLGTMGLDLPRLLCAESTPGSAPTPTADACVLIFLNGGPSHLDMWDLKPEAPSEIRGEFKPIATSLAGVSFGEHLPRLAQHAHRSCVIRSAHHSVTNAHAAAVYTALTGHDRGDVNRIIGAGPDDYPSIGSVMSIRRPPKQPVAAHVTLPYVTKEGRGGPPQPGYFGGWLGRSRDPLFVLRDPSEKDFSVPELTLPESVDSARLRARFELLGRERPLVADDSALSTMDVFRQRAWDLLDSAENRGAFRLADESAPTRDRYGRNIYGQSVLLARRLIEAGTRVVTVSWAPDANATWDTHGQNFEGLKTTLLPQFDAAISSLIEDLVDRGMFERTLVVAMGEFGRSPKINANAGRDHWNFCYSLLLAGGGIQPGMVWGSSDRIGGFPSKDPVTPADVVATIYHCLGVSHQLEMTDRLQRPMLLAPWGSPIEGILA